MAHTGIVGEARRGNGSYSELNLENYRWFLRDPEQPKRVIVSIL